MPERPLIAFLCHNEPERGSYFRMVELAQAVVRDGMAAHILVSSRYAKYRAHPLEHLGDTDGGSNSLAGTATPNWTLFHDRQEGWGVLDLVWRVLWILRHRPAVVIMASHKPTCLIPAWVARLMGTRVIYDWVDWWTGPDGIFEGLVLKSEPFLSMAYPIKLWRRFGFWIEGYLEWLAPRIAHRTVLITEDLAEHPSAPKSLVSKPIVITSGAPLTAIQPRSTQDFHILNWPDLEASSIPVLGYMAGFHGAEQLLLDALAQVARAGVDFRLVLAGAPISQLTPYQQNHLQGRIHHLGRLPFSQINEFLGRCDLLLLPLTTANYDRGRYPHKLGDYVAAGRPTLITSVGISARLFQKLGLQDMLSEPTSSAYGDLIQQWIQGRDRWESAGHRIRQAAESNWNWETIGAKYCAVVRSLISD